MRVLLLMLIFLTVGTYGLKWFPPYNDVTCGWTKDTVHLCLTEYVDSNHDDAVSVKEMEDARQKYAPWYLRTKLTTVADMFKDCDYNKDGLITARDVQLAVKTCLPEQYQICRVKWFCDRAKEIEAGN